MYTISVNKTINLQNMKKLGLIALLFALCLGLNFGGANVSKAASDYTYGDLIRGESLSSVYYYGADGFRYTFPNVKTYNTWYDNFDDVKMITDAELFAIQLGGNVTYKPGVLMVKIDTDPKTYAVSAGGVLNWVTSESVAISLYGSDWNTKIHDVPDGFFTNYTVGAPIEDASSYSPTTAEASVTDIDDDKDLVAAEVVEIEDFDFSPDAVTIDVGQTVRWVNEGVEKHTATADNLEWGTGTLNAGESFQKKFDEAGTYTYFCSYHTTMSGTIIVE